MSNLDPKKLFPILAFLFAFASLFIVSPIVAAASEPETGRFVYDDAGLLSENEVLDLEDECTSYGTGAGIEIYILTHDDASAPYVETYIENFEDQLPAGDRVYIALDMQERDVFIEGYGKAETYIHSKRISEIIDKITPSLSDGNYFDAFSTYIQMSADYMSDDSELNYDHDYTAGPPQSSDPNAANYDPTWPSDNSSDSQLPSFLSNIWIQLLIAVVIGASTVGIMAFNSGGRMTVTGYNYMDQSHSGLIGRRDDYIRTTVTRVRKPENNNNGGRGGFNAGGFRGGVSAGGRSHSSGGGKF